MYIPLKEKNLVASVVKIIMGVLASQLEQNQVLHLLE